MLHDVVQIFSIDFDFENIYCQFIGQGLHLRIGMTDTFNNLKISRGDIKIKWIKSSGYCRLHILDLNISQVVKRTECPSTVILKPGFSRKPIDLVLYKCSLIIFLIFKIFDL